MNWAGCTHNGMTANDRVHFRISTDVKDELKIAAGLEGLKPSTYIHHLIVRAIGEAKKQQPDAFVKRTRKRAVPLHDPMERKPQKKKAG